MAEFVKLYKVVMISGRMMYLDTEWMEILEKALKDDRMHVTLKEYYNPQNGEDTTQTTRRYTTMMDVPRTINLDAVESWKYIGECKILNSRAEYMALLGLNIRKKRNGKDMECD